MKNKRALLMMAVAVLFGIGAVVLASLWLAKQSASSVRRVVVAVADVGRGQKLQPEMLKLEEISAANLPKDAFSDFSRLADRVLKNNVLRGEVLSESKLAPAGTVGGLSALITEGKRAITVRVNDVIGVAGFALPGNYVDVIVHLEREPAESEKTVRGALHVSKIVLERILVLAVAQEVGRDDTKPRVVNAVTLEVTPGQAEHLDLARSVGTLSLALRNQIDPKSPATPGATKRTLLDDLVPAAVLAQAAPEPARRPAPPPKARALKVAAPARRECVSVIGGGRSSQECF
ncbi:Flp pilus assembly protein CpaB [Massilia cavernae]|uniref:Flp pilus assembly protein CpaB n=1 Tax=Massilia cavernae TaxID=2320864 RepID=A0A418Y747_9BURK|nr:Flp pilus assembly protein CpaB [Massilia cavernae]RJG25030.1 Flp pilus assembly protein CpaB [Massilia cavernae]